MGLLSKLFNSNKVKCPRCLGKGDVTLEDIKRLKKELYWIPAKCAYCNGKGKVSSKMISMVAPDIEYLTTDLSKAEREKLLKGDIGALQRANEQKAQFGKIIEDIEYLYYIENQEAEQIADQLLNKLERSGISPTERQQAIEYVKKVIDSKRTNK